MSLNVIRAGRGPALLLLHGIGSSATAWSKQIELLGGDCTCIAPDLPGYGASPDPIGEGLDAIVAQVVPVLADAPAHVLGVSFGALLALAIARARPGLVRSLILSDATLGRAHDAPDVRERWWRHRERLAADLSTHSRERAAEIAGPDAAPEIVEEIAAHMRRARPAGYLAVARAIADTDARPWLGALDVPTLVVCGEHDRVTGLDVSTTLSRTLPDARLVTVQGAGHAPHIEQPIAFAQAVREFLAGRSGG